MFLIGKRVHLKNGVENKALDEANLISVAEKILTLYRLGKASKDKSKKPRPLKKGRESAYQEQAQ